jgi:hypothetical protein
MIILVAVAALFAIDNKEFIDTSSNQMKEGYGWEYVGKTAPTGVPAITIKPEAGDEFIIFKLKK